MKQNLILSNITKIYNNNIVLNNISYTFYNKLYVVNGVNGSGKSTLIKILTKIVNPSTGKIKTNGSICYLPEKFELPRNLTTFNLIHLYIKDKLKVLEVLNYWKIPNRRIQLLSKGNFQKIGILYLLVQKSDIYILDEPTDSLDTSIITNFKESIKKLQEEDKCIILILHQLNVDELKPVKINIKEGILCEN